MECNKEEALRAKEIAETKMQNADFAGAHKIVLKAQKLYSQLDNVSQMLVVCDVHCVAAKKVYGPESDWYGLLQVEQTADEAAIKKQYRKLALQLHPDKNKFPGAEAAFKLVGEAQRILLDKDKRAQHDLKRRLGTGSSKPAVPFRPQPKPSWPSNVGMKKNFDFAAANPQHHRPPAQQGPHMNNGRPTFWTTCPFCLVKYQFYKEVVHKSIRCQHCHKNFVAYESFGPDTSKPPPPVFPQPKYVPNQGNAVGENSKPAPPQPSVKVEKTSDNKKRKQVSESSESSADSSSDEDIEIIKDAGNLSNKNADRRRSERRRQNVSYNENISDDDGVSPRKKAKVSESGENVGNVPEEEGPKTGEAAGVKKEDQAHQQKVNAVFEKVTLNGKKDDDKMNGKSTLAKDACEASKKNENADSDLGSDSLSESDSKDPETYTYPDPDFNDFDLKKEEEGFAVGQTWAIYDTVDAMPRFYAQVRKVFSSGFKLRITWLEPDPDDENEITWAGEALPVSCGKYILGKSENTEDRLMFSHLMSWEQGRFKNSVKVYPMVGETWAVFKNWSISWSSDKKRKYEYEFVEVLSEYKEGVGVNVAFLAKVRGFVSLFCQVAKEGKKEIHIPSNELFRFAHRVPSFKLTGEEREGVPKGSFELDPACLPTILPEIDAPLDTNTQHPEPSDKLKPTAAPSKVATSSSQAEAKLSPAKSREEVIVIEEDDSDSKGWDPSTFEIPEPEFFNFELAKQPPNFQVDQIWSLYCPEDGLPKYYAKIQLVEVSPVFKLYTSWLEADPQQQGNLIRFVDEDVPVSCGKFKVMNNKQEIYTKTDAFSHVSNAVPTRKKNEYIISPKKGEVWAVYKNWSRDIKQADLENCEHDIVEVLSETSLQITVHLLEKVKGFKTVYKIKMERKIPITKLIPRTEMLRFSHRIPFFRLTKEKDGSLRGFLELDPAALPVHLFKP